MRSSALKLRESRLDDGSLRARCARPALLVHAPTALEELADVVLACALLEARFGEARPGLRQRDPWPAATHWIAHASGWHGGGTGNVGIAPERKCSRARARVHSSSRSSRRGRWLPLPPCLAQSRRRLPPRAPTLSSSSARPASPASYAPITYLRISTSSQRPSSSLTTLSVRRTGVKWAVAGRTQAKLDQVVRECGGNVPSIVASSHDYESLLSMCRQTKVVISTVRPLHVAVGADSASGRAVHALR